MTDKQFRRLKRIELIEIIYRLQEEEERQQAEIASLKKQLEIRETKLSEAGSIAEAAMKLNDVFESAQAAADLYLEEVKRLRDEARAQTEG